MKRTLIPLFAAAFLFACGTPAENATDSAKEGTHTEGDGHEPAAATEECSRKLHRCIAVCKDLHAANISRSWR